MTKLLIIGSDGMLGRALCEMARLHSGFVVDQIGRSDGDLSKEFSKIHLDKLKSSDFILNCVATLADSRQSSTQVKAINSELPQRLAKTTHFFGNRLIHFSTDGVFSGKKGNYVESDSPDAMDEYGLSKLNGEASNAMNLRVSIIGHRPEFPTKSSFFDFVRSASGPIELNAEAIWNGMTAPELAKVVLQIIMDRQYKPGVFHLFSPQAVSKWELGLMIQRLSGRSVGIEKQKNAQRVDRRLASNFSLAKDYCKRSIEQQIESLIHSIK